MMNMNNKDILCTNLTSSVWNILDLRKFYLKENCWLMYVNWKVPTLTMSWITLYVSNTINNTPFYWRLCLDLWRDSRHGLYLKRTVEHITLVFDRKVHIVFKKVISFTIYNAITYNFYNILLFKIGANSR